MRIHAGCQSRSVSASAKKRARCSSALVARTGGVQEQCSSDITVDSHIQQDNLPKHAHLEKIQPLANQIKGTDRSYKVHKQSANYIEFVNHSHDILSISCGRHLYIDIQIRNSELGLTRPLSLWSVSHLPVGFQTRVWDNASSQVGYSIP